MPAPGFLLTEADRKMIQQLLNRERRQVISRPGLTPESTETSLAPEVYIALTPSGGIPALSLELNIGTGSGTGTGTGILAGLGSGVGWGNTPGAADCVIYRILLTDDIPDLVPVETLSKTVYNLSTTAISGDEWVLAVRDKFGSWLAVAAGFGDEIDTGTSADFPAPGDCDLVGLEGNDCVLATNDDGETVELISGGGGTWVSTASINYPDGLGGTQAGTLAFWFEAGSLHLRLAGMELLNCGGGCWSGGSLTGHLSPGTGTGTGVSGCAGETFQICLTCTPCSNANYYGPGWYCVDTGEATGTAGTSTSALCDCPPCPEGVPEQWTFTMPALEQGVGENCLGISGDWVLSRSGYCEWSQTRTNEGRVWTATLIVTGTDIRDWELFFDVTTPAPSHPGDALFHGFYALRTSESCCTAKVLEQASFYACYYEITERDLTLTPVGSCGPCPDPIPEVPICHYYSTDPGPNVPLLAGPFESEEDCLAGCVGTADPAGEECTISCGGCDLPMVIPVTISGVSNGSCTNCTALNTTWNLIWQGPLYPGPGPSIGCHWRANVPDAGCGSDIGDIVLYWDGADWQLLVPIGANGANPGTLVGTWACPGTNVFTIADGLLGGYCTGPVTATVTITCAEEEIVSTALGTASSVGVGVGSLTMSSVTVTAGALLVVSVGLMDVDTLGSVGVTGVTWNGQALTQALAETNPDGFYRILVAIYYLSVPAGGVGDIVLDVDSTAACFLEAVEVTGLAGNAPDGLAEDGDYNHYSQADPTNKPSVTNGTVTSTAHTYLQAACVQMTDVLPLTMGTWDSPFTGGGQDVQAGTGPAEFGLSEGYLIPGATGNFTASMSGGSAGGGDDPVFWAEVMVAFK